jgi:hypothetical protein
LTVATASDWLLNRRVSASCGAPGGQIHFAGAPGFVNFFVGGLLAVFLPILAIDGLRVDFRRTVQQFSARTRFTDRLAVARASRLIWGEPTVVESDRLNRSDFEELVRFLVHKNANFFVFPDGSILYGLVGRVPPQPVLYFWPDHSYRAIDIPRIDSAMLRQLKSNGVRIFVREKMAWRHRQDELERFPQTWSWIRSSFRPVREFGLFEVWERP